ncbi:hypothetical protein B1750_gp331 [Noumeavirus]|uniref:hypothetical protein n=1 Tax=Noumeavirus TaxID=1955558 RepID=UPI000982D128|nr:hypothetical protein B1750_gp331 [Noumeavirus]AQM73312.1 hypothetical protein NMV_331 [Noumeavirus]
MQKFLKKREVLVLRLVSETVPVIPENFRKKERLKCFIPLFDETSFVVWDELASGKKMVEILEKTLQDSSVCGKIRLSLLPDGTRDGPFHMVPEERKYWTITEATGSYKMGKKHGIFRYVFHLHSRVIREERWYEDVLKRIKIVTEKEIQIYRFFGNGLGHCKEFLNGYLSEKIEFKGKYVHGKHEIYMRDRRSKKLRTRKFYCDGRLVSEERKRL